MDVTLHRQHLADVLRGAPGSPGADEDALERLLLAFEELVSNGMRHGRAPVRAAVTAFDGCWLLEVSDADVDRPPAPAVGRDPASGGLGLHLVASICTAHGWQPEGSRKTVWALVEHPLATSAPGGDPAAGR
jgi:anti-sigma regulatory factor (Ser/Thr protein kinase)